jgi:hypothetical protein
MTVGNRVRHSVAFHGQLLLFVTKACARKPSAASRVDRIARGHRTLLAGAAGELARATRLRQARPSSACTFSEVLVCGMGRIAVILQIPFVLAVFYLKSMLLCCIGVPGIACACTARSTGVL